MVHLQLLEDAKVAIDRLFSDTSVSQEVTRDSLRELQEDIEVKIESLEE